MRTTSFSALAAFLLALPLAQTAQADFQLSSRYSDSDGDMVADVPTDSSQWRDPSTLIFAYTPVEDPAMYADVWSGFLDHMSEVTGKRVQFFPVQSNAAQIEAMRAGRLHVAGFSTGTTPLAVACAGFRPFTMMAAEDGAFGYEMEIITWPGSGIDDVEGLKGKEMAFTSETSNSGFKAPSAILDAEFGLQAGRDYETVFSGAHDSSILGVVNHDYTAAAIANSVRDRMVERGVVQADQMTTLYTSQTFPTTGYGVAHDLNPELQEKIQEAFRTFDWQGSGLEKEFGSGGESQFVEINFKDDWEVIRTIDEANGVSYECG